MKNGAATAGVAAAAMLLVCSPSLSAPFPTSDQNPLLLGFDLPTPWSARLTSPGTTSVGATLNWSSTAVIQRDAAEMLIVDAESREWRIDLEHTFTDRFALRAQLPYRSVGAGTLDGFIDNWHSIFGLPEGERPVLPHDQYRINYQRDGIVRFNDADTSHTGLGNVRLEAGYRLAVSRASATSMWLSVKLPTAANYALTGNAVDIGVGIANERDLSSRWRIYGQAAAVHLGSGRVLTEQQRSWLLQGFLIFDYLAGDALTLTMQLEGHTAVYKDSGLDQLGNAWLLTFGGDYRFTNNWRVQFGIGEDVKVEASPDVNFVLNVSKGWR